MRVGYAEQRKEKADAAAAAKPALDASPFSQEAGGQPGGQPEGEGGAAEALPKPRQLQVKIGGAEALAGSQLDTGERCGRGVQGGGQDECQAQ